MSKEHNKVIVPIQTKTLTDIRKQVQKVGDELLTEFETTKSLKHGLAAIAAYNTALKAMHISLVYQKFKNQFIPDSFFED
jgi:hypothetical protein